LCSLVWVVNNEVHEFLKLNRASLLPV
jgi:hypothetical protein